MIFSVVEEKPKTKLWEITSRKHGDSLGFIKWWAQWRQYCFFPHMATLFNARCLSEIVNFLNQANSKHRKRRKEETRQK